MDPLVVGILGLIGMFVLIALHVPIGVAMGVAGYVAFGVLSGFKPAASLFAAETASALSNMELAVIPLFLLMGGFAQVAGLSSDIYRLAYAMIGHRRGGLAYSTIFGCAGFGAVCGSSIATAATMTRVSLPEMLNRRYKPSLATGSIAAGGTLGMLIPPSIIMVLYAVLAEEFVIALFVAAIVPGLIAVLLHFVAIAVVVRLDPDAGPAGTRIGWYGRLQAMIASWAFLVLAIIVAGGIYGGVFTVTEAASMGAFGAFAFAVIRKRMTWSNFFDVLIETAATTGMIYMIIIGATVFTYFVTISEMPKALIDGIEVMALPGLAVITLLLIMYLILGSIFDTISSMLITFPFVMPLITSLGYDPIWWGIMMVMVIEIGLITPPIGLNVFVVHGMARNISLKVIFVGILPFLVADLVRLLILTLFPDLTLWLPSVLL